MKNIAIVNLQPVTLLKPVFNGNATLFEALKKRRTCRSISYKEISLQILSDILWAASGVNRLHGPFGSPGLTAGSASNSQEIYVYIARHDDIPVSALCS